MHTNSLAPSTQSTPGYRRLEGDRDYVDISQYVDRLTQTSKGKYECPVCNGKNLSYNKEKPTYFTCHSGGCERIDILKAIAPERFEKGQAHKTFKRSPAKKAKPAPIPESGELARFPHPYRKPTKRRTDKGTVTTYQYSETQWVERLDPADGSKKSFCPYHVADENGIAKPIKGDQPWPLYKEEEAITYGSGKWPLFVEGEKCTEASFWLQFIAVTPMGGYSDSEIESAILRLWKAGAEGIARVRDMDKTGKKKSDKVAQICHEWGIPTVDLADYLPLPENGDIADWIKDNMDNRDELIRQLEEAFQLALQAERADAIANDPDTLFKLDLQAYVAEPDFLKQIRQKGELCAKYRIKSQDLDQAIAHITRQQNTPKATGSLSLAEFLDKPIKGLEWLVPGFLPKGETIILSGNPKAGKSLLAVDAGFCLATGEDPFLGEVITERKKVLIISVDESESSTRSKVLRRGFRKQDSENLRLMTSWDISQIDVLESELEDFRPDITIIDSLKRITIGREINENSAEFADNIYKLKELLTRYGSAGILIHHSNKDKDATGIEKLRGSTAIAGAVWGVWELRQIPVPDPDYPKRLIIDPRNPERTLYCHSRDTEGQLVRLMFNPDDSSYECLGEVDTDPERAAGDRTMKDRILSLLGKNPQPLSGVQICELLEVEKEQKGSVYTNLSRLANKRLINAIPAPNDKRYVLYSLPSLSENSGNTLPPPPTVSNVICEAENHTQQDLQTYNNHITPPPISYNNPSGVNSLVMPEKSCTEEIPASYNNQPQDRGGEWVLDEVENLDDCGIDAIDGLEAIAPTIQPTPTSKPPSELKCGDEVLIVYPRSSKYGETATLEGKRFDIDLWRVKFADGTSTLMSPSQFEALTPRVIRD